MPEMTYGELTLLQAQNKRITELEALIELMRADSNEQARLLGMSGEREAKLLADIERLSECCTQRGARMQKM